MDIIFKTCITFKFSDFVVRSILSAGRPYIVSLTQAKTPCPTFQFHMYKFTHTFDNISNATVFKFEYFSSEISYHAHLSYARV